MSSSPITLDELVVHDREIPVKIMPPTTTNKSMAKTAVINGDTHGSSSSTAAATESSSDSVEVVRRFVRSALTTDGHVEKNLFKQKVLLVN